MILGRGELLQIKIFCNFHNSIVTAYLSKKGTVAEKHF